VADWNAHPLEIGIGTCVIGTGLTGSRLEVKLLSSALAAGHLASTVTLGGPAWWSGLLGAPAARGYPVIHVAPGPRGWDHRHEPGGRGSSGCGPRCHPSLL